jgi:hypothetical protein
MAAKRALVRGVAGHDGAYQRGFSLTRAMRYSALQEMRKLHGLSIERTLMFGHVTLL